MIRCKKCFYTSTRTGCWEIVFNTIQTIQARHPWKHLKNTKLYSIQFLRTEMTSDLSNSNRGYIDTSRQTSIFCDSLRGLTSFLSSKTQQSRALCSLSVLWYTVQGTGTENVLYRYFEDSFAWRNYMGS